MRKVSIYCLCTLWLCSGLLSENTLGAQSLMRGWEVGPWGGVSYYFGDLNTNYRLDRPNPAGGILARYNFNERLAFSLSGNYGKIEAYDSDSRNPYELNRNLSFETDIWEATALFEFNFLPYFHGSRDDFFTPYLFGGLSLFSFNPMAEYDGLVALDGVNPGEMVELRSLGTEGQFKGEEYYTTTAALTYGMGFKFDINYEWSINIHIGARSTYTDYLDDVSSVYPDRTDLLKDRGELAVYMSSGKSLNAENGSVLGLQGRQRGDSNDRDTYLFAGVGVMYYFGDVRCPSYGKGSKRR